MASWNIANLGAQKRTDDALKVIAHLLKRFDLIAVQEVNAKFSDLPQGGEVNGRLHLRHD